MLARTVTGPCVVRASSGGSHPQPPQRSASPAPHGLHPGPACVVDNAEAGGCIRSDCEMCSETLHRGIVSVRLPCGHIVRAQIIDTAYSMNVVSFLVLRRRTEESNIFFDELQHLA